MYYCLIFSGVVVIVSIPDLCLLLYFYITKRQCFIKHIGNVLFFLCDLSQTQYTRSEDLFNIMVIYYLI